MDKNKKNTRTTCISPKPKNSNEEKTRGDLGRNLHPWKEVEVGNDPTGRNARRVAGGGDPARSSGGVLERERETAWGLGVNGYGGVGTPPACL